MATYKAFGATRLTDFALVTTETYLPKVVNETACLEHKALYGESCFVVPKMNGGTPGQGICGQRARRGGMNSPIRPESLSNTGWGTKWTKTPRNDKR